MKFRYQERHIEIDPGWAQAAVRFGMTKFALSEDGFAEALTPSGGSGPLPKRLSAIYFWRAENGETYIGQAVDVQARLRQHYKNHRDLLYAAFLPVAVEALDGEERRLIALAESDFRMRNVKLVKDSASFRPFDEFLSSTEQADFVVRGNPSSWMQEPRRNFPILETRSRAKRASFDADADIAELLQVATSEFVLAAIPKPNRCENRFWSATYLGGAHGNLVRVNVGVQEVFTIATDGSEFYLRLISPRKFSRDVEGPVYATDSFVSYLSWNGAASLFASTARFEAMREFVVWLARHTTPLNNRSHCPWLYVPEMTDRWKRLK